MRGGRSGGSGGDLGTLFRLGVVGDWPDDRLLGHFLGHRDAGGEAAFEALVRRHGPMVWRVCRGVLGDPHAAEDAFQATFLVLAERAGAIRRRASAASWLYGVARRIALRARADAARRRAIERRAARPEAVVPGPEALGDDEALLREVDRLPPHYRGPIVLHDLGGCSYEEVARRLSCPVGTVKARLHRARALLRRRLDARGQAPTASPVLPLAVSLPLADRTVRSAVSLAMGRAAITAASPAVVASARWMLDAMLLSQLKTAAAVVATLGLLAAGAAGVIASQGPASPAPADPPPAPIAAGPPAAPIPPLRQVVAPPVEEIDRRALEIAAALDDPVARSEALLYLGRSQARRSRAEAALETLRRARRAAERIPPDARTSIPHPIVRVAEALADAGERDAALETFRKAVEVVEQLDDGGQLQNWRNVLMSWDRAVGREGIRAAVEAARAFTERRAFGFVPAQLVELDARAGDFEGALRAVRESEAFRTAKGERLRKDTLVQIAAALRAGDQDAADEVLAAAKGALQADEQPIDRSYGALAVAEAEARLGRFDDARATIGTVDPAALPFDVDSLKFNIAGTFIALAEAQLARGDRAGALESVDDAVRVVETIETPSQIPHRLSQATQLYLKLGEIEKAEGLSGRGGPPAFFQWEQLADAKHEAGDEAGARLDLRRALEPAEAALGGLLDRPPPGPGGSPSLKSLRYTITIDPIAQAAANVARLRLKLGDREGALGTIDEIPEAARPEFLPALAATLAERGELDAAWGLAESIESPELRERAIVRIALAMPSGPGAEATP